MKFTAIIIVIFVSLFLSSMFGTPQSPAGGPGALPAGSNPGTSGSTAAGMATAQIVATVSGTVSSPATYGSLITFGTIYGLPAGGVVPANSTELVDSSGATIDCLNVVSAVSSSGTLQALVVRLLGNATQGPFDLAGQAGNSSFTVKQAGISSIPSGQGSAIFVYPRSQSPGGTVIIYGSDFIANQSLGYPVVGNQSYPGTQATATDSNGAFHTSFQLSDMSAGEYTVRMSGAIRTTANLTVVPYVSLMPAFGHVGQKIIASLSGFTPGAQVNVAFGKGHSNSARASGDGKAVLILDVPSLSYGAHVVYANSTGFSTETQFVLNSSTVVLSEYGASPGTHLTAYAQGFEARLPIHLEYNGKTLGQSSMSGTNGTAAFDFVVPAMTAGQYTLQAAGPTGRISNLTTLTVRPTIVPSTGSVYVGESVQLTGGYYYPSSTVHVYVGSLLVPGTFQSGPNGTVHINLTIPAVPGGNTVLGAHDAEGNNATVFSMTILPSISIGSTSAASGSTVRVRGTGFVPGSTLTLLWNGQPMAVVSNVTANGTFVASVPVPHGTPGSYLVTVQNSTAPGIVFNLTGKTGFTELLPAIILPLATAVVVSSYLFVKFRVRKPGH